MGDADVIEHEIEREIKDDARFGTIDVEENEEVKEAEEWYMEYLNNQWLVIGIIAVILICCLISSIWFFYDTQKKKMKQQNVELSKMVKESNLQSMNSMESPRNDTCSN